MRIELDTEQVLITLVIIIILVLVFTVGYKAGMEGMFRAGEILIVGQ